MRLIPLIIVTLMGGGCCQVDMATDRLLIQTANGLVRGKDNGEYYSWESIPYAEAPVGALRFEAPRPYRRQWTKVFDATVKYPNCLQWSQMQEGDDKRNGIEDCLTVNIYKPKSAIESKMPVMVFIHGGSFMFGGDDFDEHYLMEHGKMMLVKILYRLGPLGFLSTEDEAISGNFGLKDQRLALRWIKDNIEMFGGDASKIMVTGFSAGGASTHYHTLQPSFRDIAKVAVSFSGVSLNPWALIRNARSNANKMGKLMNCSMPTNSQKLKICLQQKDARDIVAAVKNFHNIGYNPFTTFGPVIEDANVENAFLTRHPEDAIKSGNISHIPWLAAYTTEDGGYNAAELMSINPETNREFIYELNERWLELAPQNLFLRNFRNDPVQYAKDLKNTYMGNLTFMPENYIQVQEIYTDVLFRHGKLKAMQLHSKHSKAPVYGFVYGNPADYAVGYMLTGRKDIDFGSNHVDDVSLVLKVSGRSPMRSDEKVISKKLIQMLHRFVDTGKLSYGSCYFTNNAGRPPGDLELLLITRHECEKITERIPTWH